MFFLLNAVKRLYKVTIKYNHWKGTIVLFTTKALFNSYDKTNCISQLVIAVLPTTYKLLLLHNFRHVVLRQTYMNGQQGLSNYSVMNKKKSTRDVKKRKKSYDVIQLHGSVQKVLHVGVKWLTTEYSGLILNILWQLYDRECCSTWSSHSHSLEWLLQQSTYLETLCSLSNQSRCNPLSVPLHIYLLFNSLLKFSTQKLFYVRMTNAYYKYLCMYINL